MLLLGAIGDCAMSLSPGPVDDKEVFPTGELEERLQLYLTSDSPCHSTAQDPGAWQRGEAGRHSQLLPSIRGLGAASLPPPHSLRLTYIHTHTHTHSHIPTQMHMHTHTHTHTQKHTASFLISSHIQVLPLGRVRDRERVERENNREQEKG